MVFKSPEVETKYYQYPKIIHLKKRCRQIAITPDWCQFIRHGPGRVRGLAGFLKPETTTIFWPGKTSDSSTGVRRVRGSRIRYGLHRRLRDGVEFFSGKMDPVPAVPRAEANNTAGEPFAAGYMAPAQKIIIHHSTKRALIDHKFDRSIGFLWIKNSAFPTWRFPVPPINHLPWNQCRPGQKGFGYNLKTLGNYMVCCLACRQRQNEDCSVF